MKDSPRELKRPRYDQPSSLKLQECSRGHQVLLRWFRPLDVLFAFPLLFYDAFAILTFKESLFATQGKSTALFFSLLFLVVGGLMTYASAACFLNSTTIELSDGRLRITHGPLRWKGNLDLDSVSIKQFFLTARNSGRGHIHYQLCALFQDDLKINLMESRSLETLRFLEQHLETLLEIDDAPVVGEHLERTWW